MDRGSDPSTPTTYWAVCQTTVLTVTHKDLQTCTSLSSEQRPTFSFTIVPQRNAGTVFKFIQTALKPVNNLSKATLEDMQPVLNYAERDTSSAYSWIYENSVKI